MSKEYTETIKCPKCGKENKITIWQSLNSTLDPEAKQQLIDGKLFRYNCSKCGFNEDVDYPLLYNDMEHNVMVQYVHEDEVENAKASFAKTMANMPVQLDTKLRIVTNRNALMEKAAIFDKDLDDRIIEFIKYFYLKKVKEERPEANIQDAYFYVDGEDYCIAFLGDTPLGLSFTRELYDNMTTIYQDIIKQYDDEAVIDQNWIAKLYSEQ